VNKHFPCVCRLRGQGHPVCLPAGGIAVPAGILVVDKGPSVSHTGGGPARLRTMDPEVYLFVTIVSASIQSKWNR
jgi:hypothetical protein